MRSRSSRGHVVIDCEPADQIDGGRGRMVPSDDLGHLSFGEAVPLLIDERHQRLEVVHAVGRDQHVDRVIELRVAQLTDLVEEAMPQPDGPLGRVGTCEQLVLRGEHRWQAGLERMATQDGQAERVDGADGHLVDGGDVRRRQLGAELVDQVARGALGERDRRDRLGRASCLEHLAKPADERLGLARAGARRPPPTDGRCRCRRGRARPDRAARVRS